MAYQVVFVNGEKRELRVEAGIVYHDANHPVITFKDDSGTIVAMVPVDRILYIKKV